VLTDELKLGIVDILDRSRKDWNVFASEVLGATLDKQQQEILRSVQFNKLTSVSSGTARGKDFVSAVAALCFLYLTPNFDESGKLVDNTKVALTAPTDRQILNIMMPEVSRLYGNMVKNGFRFIAGNKTAYSIKTGHEEWFLTGFKADEHHHEAWSGFHAVNTMFVVTEASGIAQGIWDAIEGNLQGNSRLLIVFNPNISTGYAAQSQKLKRWNKFRLDSLNAPNVIQKKAVIPGQVDYEWVKDKVETWCIKIPKDQKSDIEGDFEFEGLTYRPNDLFRVKVRGMFPKVAEDILIPQLWIDIATERWAEFNGKKERQQRIGVDIAGMGRDSSSFCHRYGNYVEKFHLINSGGVANHMEVAGVIKSEIERGTERLNGRYPQAFIDTIGEGAGVFSRLQEQDVPNVYSVKVGTPANGGDRPLKDITDQYTFKNLRAYLYWCIRDWLNPDNSKEAMLPPDQDYRGLTELKWNFRSDGSIELEPKKDLIERIKRSPDVEDSLSLTFYPVPDTDPHPNKSTERLMSFYPL
jgi:hypothetical protein